MNEPAEPTGAEPLRLNSSNIRTASALQSELAAHLDGTGPVRIDASAIKRVDTATLQLLAAFIRDLRAASRTVEWCGGSETLHRAAMCLGLAPAMGLPASKV